MSFTDILGMSISSSVIILLMLFIRKFLREKIPARVMAAMWLIPAAKLLIPCARGFYTVINKIIYALGFQKYLYLDYSPETGAFSPVKEGHAFIADRYAFPFSVNLGFELPRGIIYIWLAGAVFTGALYVFRHIRFIRNFACALPCGYDISELKKAFGIKRNVRLRVSEFADAPFTYGILRPVIILPKNSDFDVEDQIKNILCHELAHIKRFDVLYKSLLAVCAAVHWFDPLVRIMFSFASRDIELACDDTAVSLGKASPEEYAFALIGAEERRCCYNSVFWDGGKLEERIAGIMSEKKKCRELSFAAAAGVIAAALVINVAAFDITEERSSVMEAVVISGDGFVSAAEAEYYAADGGVSMIEITEADPVSYEEAYSEVYTLSYDGLMITFADSGTVIECVSE